MKTASILLALVIVLGFALATRAGDIQSRIDFASKISQLKPGMSTDEVIKIVGMPDEKQNRPDVLRDGDESLWCYGVSTKGGLPTLGSVKTKRGKVVGLYGLGPCKIKDSDESDEITIRQALQNIHDIGCLNGHNYNPAAMIRTVNGLQQLGKNRALAMLREYCRVVPRSTELRQDVPVLVMRLLFPSKQGGLPTLGLGGPSPEYPKPGTALDKATPLFPFAIVEDVPLLLVFGFARLGSQQPILLQIDYLEQHGTLRQDLLKPTDDLGSVFDKATKAPFWPMYRDQEDHARKMLTMQILRAAQPLLSEKRAVAIDSYLESTEAAKLLLQVKKLSTAGKIAWDAGKNAYTLVQNKSKK